MHNFEQVREVLDFGRELHTQIEKFYKKSSAQEQQVRVKMLLDYLSRHEKHMAEGLKHFEEETKKSILDFWLQYAPSAEIEDMIKGLSVHPAMTVDEVIKIAMDFDDALVELYKDVAREADDPDVKAVFENLVEMENHEKLNVMRNTMLLNDF